MRDREQYDTLGFVFRRPSLKNERSLNDLNVIFPISMISNPQGIKKEGICRQKPKEFQFWKSFKPYVKNLDKICMIAQANLLIV